MAIVTTPIVYILNGSILVPKTEDTIKLRWLTEHPRKPDYLYFHPNHWTKELFIRDFKELRSSLDIRPEVIEYLATLDLIFKRHPIAPLVELPGIELEDYQKRAVELMLERSRLAIFLGPGTGKTYISAAYLKSRQPKYTLILTPPKVVHQFNEEIAPLLPEFTIYEKDIIQMRTAVHGNYIFIANIEQIDEFYLKVPWTTLIVDESHKIKGFEKYYNQVVKEIARVTPEVYVMTGTPQDRTKFEIIGQLSVLSERFINDDGKSLFLHRFFELSAYGTPLGAKFEREKELDFMIANISYGYRSEEVLELPPRHDIVVSVPKVTKLYNLLKKTRLLETSLGDVVLDTPAALKMKLLQVLSGFILLDNGVIADVESNKPAYLEKTILDYDIKEGIIYTFFNEEQHIVAKVLKKLGRSFVKVDGKTSPAKADNYIKQFKEGEVQFLVIKARSGGTGLNLQRVHHTIYYHMPSSFIDLDQSEKRTWRRNQKNECYFFYLITNNSIEEDIYKTVKIEKQSYSKRAFDLFIKKEKD